MAYVTPWAGREKQRWSSKVRETLEQTLPEYIRMRAEGDMEAIEETWRDEALGLAETRGLTVDPSDHEAVRRLCRALNETAISAGEDRLRRLGGEDVAAPPEPERPQPKAKAPLQGRVPLMEVFKAYAIEQGISEGVRYEWGRYHQRLIYFLGHDDLARLTVDDVIRWKDHLLAEPTAKGSP